MDSIQITLAIAAVTIVAAVTFSKAKANVGPVDPAGLTTTEFARAQLPESRLPIAGHAAMARQGVLMDFLD